MYTHTRTSDNYMACVQFFPDGRERKASVLKGREQTLLLAQAELAAGRPVVVAEADAVKLRELLNLT